MTKKINLNLTKEQKELDIESNDRARIEKIKEVKENLLR